MIPSRTSGNDWLATNRMRGECIIEIPSPLGLEGEVEPLVSVFAIGARGTSFDVELQTRDGEDESGTVPGSSVDSAGNGSGIRSSRPRRRSRPDPSAIAVCSSWTLPTAMSTMLRSRCGRCASRRRGARCAAGREPDRSAQARLERVRECDGRWARIRRRPGHRRRDQHGPACRRSSSRSKQISGAADAAVTIEDSDDGDNDWQTVGSSLGDATFPDAARATAAAREASLLYPFRGHAERLERLDSSVLIVYAVNASVSGVRETRRHAERNEARGGAEAAIGQASARRADPRDRARAGHGRRTEGGRGRSAVPHHGQQRCPGLSRTTGTASRTTKSSGTRRARRTVALRVWRLTARHALGRAGRLRLRTRRSRGGAVSSTQAPMKS